MQTSKYVLYIKNNYKDSLYCAYPSTIEQISKQLGLTVGQVKYTIKHDLYRWIITNRNDSAYLIGKTDVLIQ